MSELYGVIGTRAYDQLLADPQGADTIAIPCKPGNGAVKRGTIMYREATGLYSPAAAEQIVSTNQLVVLNEDVDTGSAPASGTVAVAADAAAYRAGRFVDGRVKLADDAALTDAHKVILRMQNIVFDQMENTASLNNSMTGT